MKMKLARSLNVRERVTMVAIVGAMAAVAVGGSLAYQTRGGGDEGGDLLVPLPPAAAPSRLSVPARGGESGERAGDTAKVSEEPTEVATALPASDARTATKAPAAAAAREVLVVYVTGAVKKPGIVTMHAGDRIFQAIHEAGGFKTGAVKDVLNLADRLQDGDQIHVPAHGDTQKSVAVARPISSSAAALPAAAAAPIRHATAAASLSPRAGRASRPARVLGRPAMVAAAPAGVASPGGNVPVPGGAPATTSANDKLRNPGDGTLNINTADSADLQRLVRCGPAMAERILAYRQQIGGRFDSPQQLMDVKGVGEKTFAKWEPFVTVK